MPETDEEDVGFSNPADVRAEEPDALKEYADAHEKAVKESRDNDNSEQDDSRAS